MNPPDIAKDSLMSTRNNIMKNTVAKAEGGRMKDESMDSSFILHPSSFPRRRGSVLIMVVALLVLIALIATAMLSTTRNDRFASIQHQQNVQIDLLVEGAKQIAIAAIVDDVIGDIAGTKLYRPGDTNTTVNGYDPFDTTQPVFPVNGNYSSKNDKWLMPRLPVLRNFHITDDDSGSSPNWPAPAQNGSNVPIWASITGPLATNQFEAPASDRGNAFSNTWACASSVALVQPNPPSGPIFPVRSDIMPSFYTTASGVVYPALGIWDPLLSTPRYVYYIAADTDGDGIADAMLQKLPMGPINGVTYFVGYRIIDNNSAINPNTATSTYVDFKNNGPILGRQFGNLAIFPSSIGLAELIRGFPRAVLAGGNATLASFSGDFNDLVRFRTNAPGNAEITPDGIDAVSISGKQYPRDDSGGTVNTSTFQYLSYADALWMGLGRRIQNPGYATEFQRYQAFTSGDAMNLSFPFAIRNPNASKSQLETKLQQSSFNFAPTAQYFGNYDGLYNWYTNNFDGFANSGFNPTVDYISIRSILAPYNPTSNQASNPGLATPQTFDFSYVNMASLTLNAESVNIGNDAGPKISINTAPIPDLIRGFFSTIAEGWDAGSLGAGSPFTKQIAYFQTQTGNATITYSGDYLDDPYWGMKWDNPAPTVYTTDLTAQQKAERNPAAMFRSALRVAPPTLDTSGSFSANAVRIPPSQMVKLRAAIAAANAKEARDADYDIDPIDVSLQLANRASSSIATVTARIYGLEAQVFISEIFVHTDTTTNPGGGNNPAGYIAIEIYNPNSFDIDLSQCALMGIDRPTNPADTVPAYTFNTLLLGGASGARSNMSDSASLPSFNVCVAPAGGYLVLENYDAAASGAGTLPAKYRPAASKLPMGYPTPGVISTPAVLGAARSNFCYVPDLHTVVYNKELVLVRPLASVRTTGAPSRLMYASAAATNISNFAPLDSFDFTGLNYPGALTGPSRSLASAWHYKRANDEGTVFGTHGWHFVYPGRYNALNSRGAIGSTEPTRPRQQGTLEASTDSPPKVGWDPASETDPWTVSPVPANQQPTLGADLSTGAMVLATNFAAAYPNTFPMQLPSTDLTLPRGVVNPLLVSRFNNYPFGGFARNGDIMDVPFIGAYRILASTQNAFAPTALVELNSVSMDAAMAEDTDVRNDPTFNPSLYSYGSIDNGSEFREQIGKFCPIYNTGVNSAPEDSFAACVYGDFPPPDSVLTDVDREKLHYHWCKDLPDYFTVLNPHDDSLPNASAATYRYTNESAFGTTPLPISGVSNSGSAAALSNANIDGSPGMGSNPNGEDSEPLHGLVNINTAPWQVLAMVPWFPGNNNFTAARDVIKFLPNADPRLVTFQVGSDGVPDNEQLARALVMWRDGCPQWGSSAAVVSGNGPFQSIYDLYRVPAFRSAQAIILASADPEDLMGDLSPWGNGTDQVRGDAEEQSILMRRVSNLITTRSDTFTVYLVVQGWRLNPANRQDPQLVTQRRAAMIVDRSRVTPTNPTPIIYNIPTQQ
jgi:hypothetical protein